LSLNKFFKFALIFLFSLILISCGEKNNKKDLGIVSKYNDPVFVLNQTKALLGNNVMFAKKGSYDLDTVVEVAAGTETSSAHKWGIRFYFLKLIGNNLTEIYDTGLLTGSFKESLINKIKFPEFDYELIYYNSQDYFLGSGGGEIFSDIINLNEHQVYYAHLIIESPKPVSLFISKNTDEVKEIKDFFVNNFKRDYPSLKLINKDISIDN